MTIQHQPRPTQQPHPAMPPLEHIFVEEAVLTAMADHALADPALPVMGHLLGQYDAETREALVLRFLPSERALDSLAADDEVVREIAEAYNHAIQYAAQANLTVVGWYESSADLHTRPIHIHKQRRLESQVTSLISVLHAEPIIRVARRCLGACSR